MARNIAATNAGVGQASVSTRIKLTIQAAKKCLLFGALPLFVAPIACWISAATPQEYDVAKLGLTRLLVDGPAHRKWRMRDERGVRRIISVEIDDGPPVQYIAAKDLPEVLGEGWKPVRDFQQVAWIALTGGALGYLGVWQLFVLKGRQQQANRRIRGAHDVVAPSVLS